jgi:hypothetical protein
VYIYSIIVSIIVIHIHIPAYIYIPVSEAVSEIETRAVVEGQAEEGVCAHLYHNNRVR